MDTKKLMLIILDGFGLSLEKKGNAIAQAKTPFLDKISSSYPGTIIQASGPEVGLAWGEMGNSEVGHGNIGGGLVIYQNLTRINAAIADGSFYKFPQWAAILEHIAKKQSKIHIMGLVSNGGVHSHIDHIISILKSLKEAGDFPDQVMLHFFSDGQDVSPQSAEQFYDLLIEGIHKLGLSKNVTIASLCGRYYAMDKSENWERTEKAYLCLTQGTGQKAQDFKEVLKTSYKAKIYDEKLLPTVFTDESGVSLGLIEDHDAVIFFNFRPDRARQLTQAFIFDKFSGFKRTKQLTGLLFITMTEYGADYPATALFDAAVIAHPLASLLAKASLKQFHIAETEKYAHVTYFFNGGTETQFKKEDRAIIDSPKVKSYDEKPAMSAHKIVSTTLEHFKDYDFILVNLANGDMVGHTGNLKASKEAVEVLDESVEKLVTAMLKENGTILITADHGNVEEMINLETDKIDKEHSTNPVPLWIISPTNQFAQAPGPLAQLVPTGILADIAPTILDYYGIKKPAEMTGTSLLAITTACPLPK